MFLVFSGGAVGVYIAFDKLNNDVNCKDLSFLEDADKLFLDGSKLLCSDYCPCKANKDWLEEYLDANDKNYRTTTGVVRVQVNNSLIRYFD